MVYNIGICAGKFNKYTNIVILFDLRYTLVASLDMFISYLFVIGIHYAFKCTHMSGYIEAKKLRSHSNFIASAE